MENTKTEGADFTKFTFSLSSSDKVEGNNLDLSSMKLDFEMIHDHRESIRGTLSTEEAVMESHISFVIIPTPSDARGPFSLTYAKSAFREIGRALRKKKEYHTVVLTSTVLPGATRLGLLPILEKESGKKCGPDFGLCYNPEFIAVIIKRLHLN